MRVMVIVKSTRESEAEDTPLESEGAAEMFAMGKYNEELAKAGIMRAGDGATRSVTDGPFAETKERRAGERVAREE